MTEPSLTAPPKRAICKEPDGETPCRFAASCSSWRQVQQGGYSKSLGQWVRNREPLRGMACWKYQQLSAQAPRPVA